MQNLIQIRNSHSMNYVARWCLFQYLTRNILTVSKSGGMNRKNCVRLRRSRLQLKVPWFHVCEQFFMKNSHCFSSYRDLCPSIRPSISLSICSSVPSLSLSLNILPYSIPYITGRGYSISIILWKMLLHSLEPSIIWLGLLET